MTYLGLKDYDLAEKYIQESLNLYLKRKNISGYADCYRELGEIYYLTNRKEKAIEVTELALKSSLEIGELESVKLCYEKLHLYHKEIHEYKKAYENLILFKKYSDSIFNEKINDDLTQQKINFELTKNDLVNKNKRKLYEQESKNKLKTQKTILIFTIIVAFLFLIISFISFQQFKKSKNQNQIIINQKKKIEHSLNEKEVLLKEVYHRVKNNLQIISSLLEIQINQNDNTGFTKSAKEIQNKIQVISLLHQNLYESDNLNYINFEKYIEELIQYFSKIYLLQNDNIKFHFNCENINLRISQAIPLGLIINELVSNAFKHSFNTKTKEISGFL
ncbi:histidine kinase dimerization/phosphoacceptor domain -containing protein [Flavobacterium piscinae]|uniref:histidine kinase dimerization/phosphoacceptor domain -containing protein n=1 Tax=Flavobacterium piscinae TaxID=2506424 RepID=UPI002AAB86BB|nr:histidine kinase dimerization/phosphoacceptor domain -containing protein [Flavobacterium piscinae]